MKRVVCIYASGYKGMLTIDKVYEVYEENDVYYTIMSDNYIDKIDIYRERFKPTELEAVTSRSGLYKAHRHCKHEWTETTLLTRTVRDCNLCHIKEEEL